MFVAADAPAEPSLVLILKWGGELTPAGRIQAEELGRIFRCMYPGGQGRHLAGSYSNFTTFINVNTIVHSVERAAAPVHDADYSFRSDMSCLLSTVLLKPFFGE